MIKVVKETVVRNRKGLHARASAEVVKLAESFKSSLVISYREASAPATSIMDLLMLGAGQGSCLIIEGKGRDAEEAVSALVSLIDNAFGEAS